MGKRSKAANHLDRIMGTQNEFPGVQLKRSKHDKQSYQVEIKVKGVSPPRNINFGCYGSLDEAKRAYNYGAYVMGSSIEELPYFSGDKKEEKLNEFCPKHVRDKMRRAIIGKDANLIVSMRKDYIKNYIDACKWTKDSSDFEEALQEYWKDLDKERQQKMDKVMQEDRNDGTIRPSPSQGVDLAGKQISDTNQQINNDGNVPDASARPSPAPVEKRKRVYTKRTVIEENKPKAPDYVNLPSHYYGILAHAGGVGVHTYPPQVDLKGDYICPCFFNHNFNTRSKRVVSNWPNDPLSEEGQSQYRMESRVAEQQHIRKRFRKYFKKEFPVQHSFIFVNDVREVYNYECRECVQDYYKGPLPLGFLDIQGNKFFMPSDHSEYACASNLEGAQWQQPHELAMNQFGSDPNRTYHHDHGLYEPNVSAVQGQEGPNVNRINEIYGTEQNQGQYLQHAFLQQRTQQNHYAPNAGQYGQRAAPQQLYQNGSNMGAQPQNYQPQLRDYTNMEYNPLAFQEF